MTASPPAATAGVRLPVLALKPLRAAENEFSGRFADAIDDAAFAKVPFGWDALGRGRYDAVVFHWPTEFFRPSARRTTMALLGKMAADRLRHGTRFVWVAHNIAPHDGGSLASPTTAALFLRLLSGVVYLSEDSRRAALNAYPHLARVPALVTVHGRYGDVVGPPQAHDARPFAGRMLFFGQIRGYKNVPALVAAARAMTVAQFSLTIVGTCPEPALVREIVAAAGGDPRIALDIRDTLVPDGELEGIIDAHDAVVLPYSRVLNSGVALHALGRNKPILAPRTGSLPELAASVGGAWVQLYDGAFATPALERFVVGLAATPRSAPDLTAYGWDRIGADMTRFLTSL